MLEAAANAGCSAIVTHNVRDFGGAAGLGIQALTPAEFMSPPKEQTR